jgi:hypothetical protein
MENTINSGSGFVTENHKTYADVALCTQCSVVLNYFQFGNS